jgi:predicted nucleic acid-binding protein
MILLDTDIMVDLLRKFPPAIVWLENLDDEELILPGFVVMELIQGCRSKQELTLLEDQIREMRVVWPTQDACDQALVVYAESRFSHGIGLLDALIGQLAVSLNLPLHTFNQKHYAGIPGLKVLAPYLK